MGITVCELCGKSLPDEFFTEHKGNESFLSCQECHKKIDELSSTDFNKQNQAIQYLYSCFNDNKFSSRAKSFIYETLGITDEQITIAKKKENQRINGGSAIPILAEIVGTRMAENGGNGYYTNSTCYSLLVYYSNGTVELIEGGLTMIRPFLHLIQPKCSPMNLETVQQSIIKAITLENNRIQAEISRLHDEFDKLHSDFNTTQAVIKNLTGLLQPIPDVVGKERHEAIHILNSNNLICEEEDRINEHITGTVIEATRDREKYNLIHVRIKYDLPDVIGIDIDDAKRILKNMGFFYSVKSVSCSDASSGNKVLNVDYSNGAKVELEVALSQSNAFLEDLDSATSMISIQESWTQHKLAESHPKTNALIEEHTNTEKQYGKSLNIGIIKLEIKHSFDKEEKEL